MNYLIAIYTSAQVALVGALIHGWFFGSNNWHFLFWAQFAIVGLMWLTVAIAIVPVESKKIGWTNTVRMARRDQFPPSDPLE